jgi:hypothetical protein
MGSAMRAVDDLEDVIQSGPHRMLDLVAHGLSCAACARRTPARSPLQAAGKPLRLLLRQL